MQLTGLSNNGKEQINWRILLVDDDEDDFVLIRQMLSDARDVTFRLEWISTF